MRNVADLLAEFGLQSVRKGNKHGGEFQGPCPGCGGDDRFHVWPEQNEGGGSYWCRQCGKAGDNIQFLIDFKGIDFKTAAAAVGRDVVSDQYQTPKVPKKTTVARFKPSESVNPADLWREKAFKFVQWSCDNLVNSDPQRRYLLKRGINIKTIKKYRLGFNPGDRGRGLFRPRESWGLPTELKNGRKKRLWLPRGIVIPYLDSAGGVLRIRIRRSGEGEPRYYALPGSNMDCMVINGDRRAQMVIESELCALTVAQAAGDLTGCVALGNSSRKPDQAAHSTLKNATLVLFALDFDQGGINQAAWWEENLDNLKLWPPPKGKDPTEALQKGVDLREWIEASFPPAWKVQGSQLGVCPSAPQKETGIDDTIPEKVRELAQLLRKHPVRILATPKRTRILSSRKWDAANWELSKHISELVYFNNEVLCYLDWHPDEIIDGDNIIQEGSDV